MKRERGSRSCCFLRLKLSLATGSPEEAARLMEVLKPDDVPVEGLNYKSYVNDNELIYEFESEHILRLRNAADEVLEHASLVEAIKGLGEAGKGVADSVREKEGRN